MKRATLLGVACVSAATATAADKLVTVTIDTEYQLKVDLPVVNPAVLATSILGDCPSIDMLGIGLSAMESDDNHSFNFNLNVDVPGAIEKAVDVVRNGEPEWPTPTAGICATERKSSLVHVSGGCNLYVFALGNFRPRQRARAQVSVCETFVIQSDSNAILELPIRLKAGAFAAESFGDPNETYAKASASFHGVLTGDPVVGGSVNLGGGELYVESVTVIPEEDTIDLGETVSLQVVPGENRVTAMVTGEFEVITQAKATGLFGSLAGSATGGVDLPGSFEVGFITGSGGSPLPPGIRIVSETSGMTYADTTAPEQHQPGLSLALTSGSPILSWNSHDSFDYQVEWNDGSGWFSFPAVLAGNGATMMFRDETAILPVARLYRLRYVPVP